jgi:hypothetical protein
MTSAIGTFKDRLMASTAFLAETYLTTLKVRSFTWLHLGPETRGASGRLQPQKWLSCSLDACQGHLQPQGEVLFAWRLWMCRRPPKNARIAGKPVPLKHLVPLGVNTLCDRKHYGYYKNPKNRGLGVDP